VRDALGMTTVQLARRLGVAQSAVVHLEQSEAHGGIRLDSLRRAAAAMGCRVVYSFVPDESLERTVEGQARGMAMRELASAAHSMRLEAQGATDGALERVIDERAAELVASRRLWE